MAGAKSRAVWEFGDFQTPPALCAQVCARLAADGLRPRRVVEPTCGRGGFLQAAAAAFPQAELAGVEINPDHVRAARAALAGQAGRARLHHGDFFTTDWAEVLGPDTAGLLVLGNPPWVTNAELGLLQSRNLPEKSNFKRLSGMEAMTGKSNFDISEWMLLRYLDWLQASGGAVAVLVKTAVARKVLLAAWKRRYPLAGAALYRIDAMRHFGAAVDACLLVLRVEPGRFSGACQVYAGLDAARPDHEMGCHDGLLITDLAAYAGCGDLAGPDPAYVWRSGVKHDCARVMELTLDHGRLINGDGEAVEVEDAFLFPLLKSSDVHKGAAPGARFMLVPQRSVGEDTARIEAEAPRTWAYLRAHADRLAARGSSIYRNRPAFSVFGVGPYSFAPWKVAVSGFYKSLRFRVVPPLDGRPTVFDDTVYFLPARSQAEAGFLADLLNGPLAQAYFATMVFWEDKRPVTVDLLKRLSVRKLAAAAGRPAEYDGFAAREDGGLFAVDAA
jgi:hypothetical protein